MAAFAGEPTSVSVHQPQASAADGSIASHRHAACFCDDWRNVLQDHIRVAAVILHSGRLWLFEPIQQKVQACGHREYVCDPQFSCRTCVLQFCFATREGLGLAGRLAELPAAGGRLYVADAMEIASWEQD